MEKPPNCPKCLSEAVQANAGVVNNILYWYCQKCKDEVSPEYYHEGEYPNISDLDLLSEFERLVEESQKDPYTGMAYPDEEDDYQDYDVD